MTAATTSSSATGSTPRCCRGRCRSASAGSPNGACWSRDSSASIESLAHRRRAMTKANRWAWIISLVAITGAVLVLAFLLSIATNNRAFYERHYVWLFWVNVAVAGFLVLVIGVAALRLLLRVQRRKFGSRLLLKLAAIFALVGVI